MKLIVQTILFITAAFIGLSGTSFAVQYVKAPPLADAVKAQVQDVKAGNTVRVPLITWGGDIATILANGNSRTTTAGSIFAKKNLQLELKRTDDFKEQIKAYMQGETPYLRGTMGMINMAAELLNRDSRTKPVIIYQMTWSNGGDCLVVKSGIKSAKDLKGKTIALQAYGPHVDYLAKLLRDAGLKMSDVTIKWVKDLTGTDNTPAEALHSKDVDAAMVIIPDGLMLTSNGSVGTGAEGSVKGAKIMLSTKSANRIIADVYAVRSDYFTAHKKEVQDFVHGLLLAEQELKAVFKNKKKRLAEYKKTVTAAAEILLDSKAATADAEALYGDCEYVGFQGNVKFFTDTNWPRNLHRLTDEVQAAFITGGLLSRKIPLQKADWDYNALRKGLTGVDDVEAPRFNTEAVAQVVARKQNLGTLDEGELFSFEVFFQPNQNTFSPDQYSDAFAKVVDLASTYGGAVITVEGHSDPMGYLRKLKEKASEIVLTRTKQAAKNLSLTRAIAVRDSIMGYSGDKGVNLDPSQFTVIGHGIMQPRTGLCGQLPCPPKSKEEWLSNMRVVFRIIQIEAEEEAFIPLD
ncbi:ABC transporter substrate-binding protein [Candidatus Electrothrix sp.]|uniref:ABC transporter substrate-binding protein n=1 Tax=Candidatus Electrothrix sp. TaxID=2170559 RepID=UPI004056AFB8